MEKKILIYSSTNTDIYLDEIFDALHAFDTENIFHFSEKQKLILSTISRSKLKILQEDEIAKSGKRSYLYSKYILRSRFNKGEPQIIKDNFMDKYQKFLNTLN